VSITTEWQVRLRQYDYNLDLTDRTMGASIQQTIPVGQMGGGSATIQLDNNDGAFTPLNGGTYSDLNVYSYALEIRALINDTFYEDVFFGFVSDFTLTDDGRNSTVQISAVDPLTLAARSKVEFLNLDPLQYVFRQNLGVRYLLDGYVEPVTGSTIFEQVKAPFLGIDTIQWQVLGMDVQTVEPIIEFVGYDGYTVADLLNSSILPINPAVCFFSEVYFFPAFAGYPERIIYNVNVYDGSKVPRFYRQDFVFSENPTGTELPFTTLDRGYNMDDVVNSSQITRNDPLQYGGAPTETKTYESAESVQRFGRRNVQYSTVAIRWDDETENFGVLEPGAQQTAERWANMYDTPRFQAKSIVLSAKQVEALADDAASLVWRRYLDSYYGLWNPAQVKYTPTGGSQRTDNVVVSSRTINITPEDAIIKIELLPMVDNMNFILDDSLLGKLGGTLDVYDDTDYTYDELFGYDGHPVEGNRLY
jgi:hypothetical protein